MAKRSVFISTNDNHLFQEKSVDFKYYPGFAITQKQKSIRDLHDQIKKNHITSKILEVSSKSENYLGSQLSAFNLQLPNKDGTSFFLENIFQSSKKFMDGGPFNDLLFKTPTQAKKDERLKNSGKLISFEYEGKTWPLEPKTFFYDWLYINAINANKSLHQEILNYNTFTDIEFNSVKSINCQARSLAIFVSLYNTGELANALKSPGNFKEIYSNSYEQLKIPLK